MSRRFQIHRTIAIVLLGCLMLVRPATAVDLYYTFHDGERGGLARLIIDSETGEAGGHEVLFSSAGCRNPRKLAITDCGRYVIMASEESGRHNLFITNLQHDPPTTESLRFLTEPDEIRTFGTKAIIGGSSGNVITVDLEEPTILARWNARRDLSPSGHKTEDVLVLPCGERAIMSFQKDSRSGRHRGSRVVIVSLPELETVHDLHLPRNRPELHYADVPRETGPNPEVIHLSPQTNTFFVSLDLYGGAALADLDALREGRWSNLRYVTTAVDESWGHAFPDRFVHFEREGREFVLALNSGEAGGGAVIDLKKREVIARAAMRHGLETPIYFDRLGLVVATPAGKMKRRGPEGLIRTFHPGRMLHLLDVSQLASTGALGVETHEMEHLLFRAAPVESGTASLVLLMMGAEVPDQIGLFDVEKRELRAVVAAYGEVVRTAGFRRRSR